jgi:hypothetical protein
LWVVISLFARSALGATATEDNGPSPVVVGTWQSQTSGNAYQMRVTWNAAVRRYEGRLVVQGQGSQRVGFPLGEICWTAASSGSKATLNVREELRSGRSGQTTQVVWQEGLLYLDRSTPTQLLTSIEAFRRVADAPGGTAMSNATVQGTSAFPDLAVFPPAQEVVARVTGRDAVDTAARQFAALKTLAEILNGVRARTQDERRAIQPVYHQYSEGQGRARRQFGPAGEQLAQSYLKDPSFTDQIIHKLFPAVGSYVDGKAKAADEARAAAQAAQDEKRAALAAAKAREAAEAQARTEAQLKEQDEVDPEVVRLAQQDVRKAKNARHMELFGVLLGRAVTLPTCGFPDKMDDVREACRVPMWNGSPVVRFPSKELPPWAQLLAWPLGMPITIKGSVIVAAEIPHVVEDEELRAALFAKYGTPTKERPKVFKNHYGIESEAKEWDWKLPGLRVTFSLYDNQPNQNFYQGYLTVELESYYNAQRAKEDAEKATRRQF